MDFFEFKLDEFQEQAIKHINSNENVLVTAPTGSGKSVCAYAAIHHHISASPKKRVIYTSPIKALSNQKFAEFKRKLTNISVGIITGNKKFGMQNQVLIMTAEILRNKLCSKNKSIPHSSSLHLKLDVFKDVSCVIMDEIHFIHDRNRGHVWEETLMLLPPHINLVLLSATMQNPQNFTTWMETQLFKPCKLVTSEVRVVPLRHYFYIHYSDIHKIKDKKTAGFCRKFCNKLIPTKEYDDIQSTLKIIQKETVHKVYKKPRDLQCIGGLLHYLRQKKQFPALFFVFSRRLAVHYATMIDRTFPQVKLKPVNQVVRNLLHSKIKDNTQRTSFLLSPLTRYLIDLWSAGIAFHHAGMHPVHRELVEILFNQNYIHVLFATETFAVGLNSPIKTVVFTQFKKFRNIKMDYFTNSEYMQMAGRAGRRGIDTYGNVILCPLDTTLPPQNILTDTISQEIHPFKISCHTILSLLEQGEDLTEFPKQCYTHLDPEVISRICGFLQQIQYIDKEYKPTFKGQICSTITQVNEVLLTEFISNSKYWLDLSPNDLCILFSLFFVKNNTEDVGRSYDMLSPQLTKTLEKLIVLEKYLINTQLFYIPYESPLNAHFDMNWGFNGNTQMVQAVQLWCDNPQATYIELEMPDVKIGDFVRHILQISNLIETVMNICESIATHKLLNKIQHCNQTLLRDVVITNSLYI